MEIVSSLDWTATDEQHFAAFLDTETGRRFIPKLAQACPRPMAGGETNSILIRSGQVLGFQDCLQDIFRLAHPSAPESAAVSAQTVEYPALESDKNWGPGPKLEMSGEDFFKMQTDPEFKPSETPEVPSVTQ